MLKSLAATALNLVTLTSAILVLTLLFRLKVVAEIANPQVRLVAMNVITGQIATVLGVTLAIFIGSSLIHLLKRN